MKRILCVAVLMGLTSALHAVAYTWDANSSSFKDANGNTLGKYKDITSLVITVACQRSSNEIVTNFFSLVQKNGENSTTNLLTFGVTGSNPYLGSVTINDNAALSGGGHWSWQRAGENASFTTTFTFSNLNANGAFQKLDATYNFTYGSATQTDSWTSGVNANFNGLSFDSLSAYTNTTITSALITIDGTPVPEAGVMGLLALGVGALALRRKVAGA